MGSADPLHTLERSAITPLVRRAMYSLTLEAPIGQPAPIRSGDGEELGVYSFAGGGEELGQPAVWSLVLKALGSPHEGGEDGYWNYWKRKAMVYHSALLDDLPGVQPRRGVSKSTSQQRALLRTSWRRRPSKVTYRICRRRIDMVHLLRGIPERSGRSRPRAETTITDG